MARTLKFDSVALIRGKRKRVAIVGESAQGQWTRVRVEGAKNSIWIASDDVTAAVHA